MIYFLCISCTPRKGENQEEKTSTKAGESMTEISNLDFKYLDKIRLINCQCRDFLYVIYNIELENSEQCRNIQNAAELRNKVYHRKFCFYHHDEKFEGAMDSLNYLKTFLQKKIADHLLF